MLLSPFARVVVSSGFSNLADGVFQVALPLVALGVTRDPAAFAMVTLAGRLPWLLFALPAGALADRLDRRRTMTLVNLARAVLLAGLTAIVVADVHGIWALYLVAFALGVAETLFDTAAQSIVPSLVPITRLTWANARLYAVELTTNQFVGPPLGGLLVAIGAGVALGASAAAYAIAAVVLVFLIGSFRPRRDGPPTRIRTDIVDGVRYLARHRVLRTLALCTGIGNLAFTAMMAVLPLYVVAPGPVGLTEAGFGLLLVAPAVGSLAATAAVDRIVARLGRTRTLIVGTVVPVSWPLAAATTSSAGLIALGGVAAGFSFVVWNVVTVSLRQQIAPDGMLGRVNAGYRLMAWGTMPLGAGAAAVIGASVGVRGVFWVAAALTLLCLPLLRAFVSDDAIAASEQHAGQLERDRVDAEGAS